MRKVTEWLIIGIVAVILLNWFFLAVGITTDSIFGVWQQNVQRNIFEKTKSYNQGKIQDLAKYYHEYNQADAAGKAEIASVVRVMFADYNSDMVHDAQFYSFLEECRK